MKLFKFTILFLLLSLKGFSQQAVLTSAGDKVALGNYFLPLSGGTITGTLTVSGTTTISGTITAGAVTYPNSHGISGQVLTTSGSGTLTWTTPSDGGGGTITHTVGETFGGGIVFYVTPNGLHGLIAETQDQSAACTWYDAQNEISILNNHLLGSESRNFTDWRLPTKNELYLMHTNIGQGASGDNFNIANMEDVYWSSTEKYDAELEVVVAWALDIVYNTMFYDDKKLGFRVRAIRSF